MLQTSFVQEKKTGWFPNRMENNDPRLGFENFHKDMSEIQLASVSYLCRL